MIINMLMQMLAARHQNGGFASAHSMQNRARPRMKNKQACSSNLRFKRSHRQESL